MKTKFPFGGRFYLFADYMPEGANHIINKLEVDVQGKAPNSQTYNQEKLTSKSEAYSILLSPGHGAFSTGYMMIDGILMKDGKEIDPSTLDNYLGEKAHVVLISADDKEYIHVHQEVANGRYKLHASFTKTGVYRGRIQFQAEGKLHTTDYVIQVDDNRVLYQA